MVMSFFRKGESESGLEQITNRTVSMLADARHSFDLACTAVLGGADVSSVTEDVRATDERINRAEQELRGVLVTHLAVHGTFDVAVVLSYTLLIKKVERIGDQAKNILDLAEEGISLAGQPDTAVMVRERQVISALIAETADLLVAPDAERVADFLQRSSDLRISLESRIRELMHSTEPGSFAVPRAILYRYWKRIVANLSGIMTSVTEPLQRQDYLEDGTVDIVDD
ncbi:MAG: PhoU domain-containing protein [Acidimicrobiales bacterium]